MVALVVLLVAGVLSIGASAQPSPYNFFTQCPEGCRDVDQIQSCGSVADTTFCKMAVNGDVEMRCLNGNAYFLGQFGCSSNVTETDALDYFFDKTRHCVDFVSTEFYQYRQYFAPLLVVLSAWVTVAGYRFISPTLTIFAFVWEFFFALYLMIMAQAADDTATYIAIGLAVFVALLCLWRGPVFGRAVVGVSMGSLVSILALTIADAGIGYVAIIVVVGVDIAGIIFAYVYKRSSVIALFGFSVAVMVFVAIATWGNYGVSASNDVQTIVILTVPSLVAGVICIVINAYWCRKNAEKKRVNRRFEARGRGRQAAMLMDVSMSRPGAASPGAASSPSPTSRSPTGRGGRRAPEGYGAVYEEFSA